MNTHEPPLPLECARVAAILPLLDDPALDPTRAATVREHLRTCATCRARRDDYARLDAALRVRYGLASVPRRSTEEIMQHINESPAPAAAAPTSTSMAGRSLRVPHPPRPPRRFAGFRPALSGVAAIASVALVVALAFALFSSRFGFGFGARSYGPPHYTFSGTTGLFGDVSMVSPNEGWALAQVTKTPAGTQSLYDVTFYHYLNGIWTPVTVQTTQDFSEGGVSGFNGTISMDSANDGWAVAHNFNRFSVLLHYRGGTWSEVQGAPDIWTIQALAPNNVWAISGLNDNGSLPSLLHYDGTNWTPQTVLGLPDGKGALVVDVHMLSARDGWALVNLADLHGGSAPNNGPSSSATVTPASGQPTAAVPSPTTPPSPPSGGSYSYTDTYGLAQYAGGMWTLKTTFSGGEFANFGPFAMVSDTEGWALGQKIVAQNGITAGVPLHQLLYHYQNGHWSSTPVSVSGGGYITLESITMRSADDGWIIGSQSNVRPGTTASNYQQQTILLHYSGGTWHQVDIPNTGTPVNAVTGLAFSGDGSGWAAGYVSNISPSSTVQDTDILAQASPMLWKLSTDGAWHLYQQ
ncbi:MAG TPA: zf-HC2 domain-containing protein [Ktedonobacterales bacterium]|nr:zf-HC2 domain-containing protein [Ktedonobacterales bacterium]